jgi:tight adherence protein C
MGAREAALIVVVSACAALSALMLAGTSPSRIQAPALVRRAAAWVRDLPALRRARGLERLSRRRASCLAELPVLLDVVTLGLSAGLSFDSSLELYCERYDGELAHAFSEAMLSWRIGASTREGALASLADELGVAALGRFSSVVAEALAFGTPLAEALERQAQVMRDEQRSQIEEEIERVPVKMLIPLGTLIVPAMFLAILGPLLGSSLVAG